VIYNLYGSTEIAFATIARPQDLQKNPATVGPIVKGVKIKLFDENGTEVPRGEVGRIFVGNTFPFEGYTGGGGKQIIDGLMSSGDVGYFDHNDLLYVSGRDDEMIVSGGENVVPAEIEDLVSGPGSSRPPHSASTTRSGAPGFLLWSRWRLGGE
jgi:fatty-acyl-CoA synthase